MSELDRIAASVALATADRLALRELTAHYAYAIDSRDDAALQELFAPGAVVVIPPALARPGTGTRIDAADLLASTARFQRTRHTVHQQLVSVTGDTASAQTYGEAHHVYRRGDELRDSAIALRYQDEFLRTEDGWRFSCRELIVDWMTDQPVSIPTDPGGPAEQQ
jgi:ketosteroid isomerase-like protein